MNDTERQLAHVLDKDEWALIPSPRAKDRILTGVRRRRALRRGGVVVAAVTVVGLAVPIAVAAIDGLRQPEASTVAVGVGPTTVMSEAPATVETVGAHADANLGHGWTLITRSNTICLRAPDDADDGSCSVNIPEAPPADPIHWYGGRQAPTLMAWQVPAETSTTVVTAGDGWRLPADVYALTDVPGVRLAVVFVEDEPRFWQRPDRRVSSYDSTGAVVADWPIPNPPAMTQVRKAQAERTAN